VGPRKTKNHRDLGGAIRETAGAEETNKKKKKIKDKGKNEDKRVQNSGRTKKREKKRGR